jgi:hypothetical protein
MSVILVSLTDLDCPSAPRVVTDAALARQLTAWGTFDEVEDPPDPGVLLLSLTAWTRLHGIISLEIEGVFTQMGIDPARLYTAEINHLIAQRLDAPTDG